MNQEVKLTPMMRQYVEAKQNLPHGTVLLFRLGDFYEEFFEDAEKVSSALDLVLTKRQGVPMCGFPHHALDSYLGRLIAKGFKVAIAEQIEDPREAKGIIKRKITRIITPGTLIDNNLLNSSDNNFIAGLIPVDENRAALSGLDVSTGEFFYTPIVTLDTVSGELARLGAKEVIIPESGAEELRRCGTLPDPGHKVLWTELEDYKFDFEDCERYLSSQFGTSTLDGFGMRNDPDSVRVAGALLRYAEENLRHDASYINSIQRHSFEDYLEIDPTSMRNLELVSTRVDGSRNGSLLSVLDHTSTSLGSRRLRSWLLRPLRDYNGIERRLDVIEQFVADPLTLTELRETLGIIRDLERITARINVGNASPRDYIALSASLDAVPGIRSLLENFNAVMISDCLQHLPDFDELAKRINDTLDDDPPSQLTDGGVIRTGFSEELDRLRMLSGNGKSMLADIQQREVERTGIKSLKVKFNNVFGYYIEVSKSNLAAVPEDYVRKQTLVNAERFITPELKELENSILGAEERARALEASLFAELRQFALGFTDAIQKAANALADIDALAGLAECARVNNYIRPRIFEDDRLVIDGGRHPVLDNIMDPGTFVPNDINLNRKSFALRMMIITGPNMAGKSTYIRQNALLVIMAQMGSFIPADGAEIGLVDRIFTRIGAGDDLSRNQSTFMVEMVETSNILRNATRKSFVILDEIGRGTSTYDGLSIAWSVAEYLNEKVGCRTLFATHYHELTALPRVSLPGIANFSVAVKEYGNEIIFLRQIVPGNATRSYGIHVARLAGVPDDVIVRANQILGMLEQTPDSALQVVRDLANQPHPAVPKRRKRKKSFDNDDDNNTLELVFE